MTFSNSAEYHELMRKHSSMKALQILGALSFADGYVSITELCTVTGLSAGTTHRVLQEMLECGFVLKDETAKKYRIGFAAWSLSQQLQKNDYLVEAAQSEMVRLNDLTMETIHLIALDQEDDQGVYLAKVGCKNRVGMRSRVGGRIPLYCTSGGKAMLAWQAPEWIEGYLKRSEREKFTANTLVTPAALQRDLEVIRVRGYSLDNKEHHDDVICVSAPVFGSDSKPVCAISISAPAYRFPLEKAIEYGPHAMVSASIITEKLGGHYPISSLD